MSKIYLTLLCCAAVLPAACVPGGGLRPWAPEKTFLGYRIEVPDNNESARLEAEKQGRAFCESEHKQYEFSRLVTWSTARLGRYVPSYNFYFVCREPQVAKVAEPEKLTPEKAASAPRRQMPLREEAAVSSDRETAGKTVMIVTPEPELEPELEVSAPPADIRTIEARPSKIQVASVSQAAGRRKMPIRTAKASDIWFTTRDKDYIPGEPESLAAPGEEVHSSILGGHFVEEPLGN